MKIAILEIECHAEVLRSTFELFSEFSNYQITIFTTPEILEETGYSTSCFSNFQFILKNQNVSEVEFIRTHLEVINQNNYLLINTLQRKFHIYNQLDFKLPILLRVHNVHFYWSSNFQNKNYLTSDFRLIVKEIYKKEFKHRRQFLNRVSKFLFPSTTLMEYALKEFNIESYKAIHFPFDFLNNSNSIKKTTTTIIIPGKVDRKRKDFGLIRDFVSELSNASKSETIKIVFLGVLGDRKARTFIDSLKSNSSNNLEIITFETLVSAEEYSNYFQETDFVVCPIKTDTTFQLSKEKYGLSKISGGVNDAIHFGKTCFVPGSYCIDDELKGVVVAFNDAKVLVENILEFNRINILDRLFTSDSIYQKENQKILLQALFK